jgi:hypothetical protein
MNNLQNMSCHRGETMEATRKGFSTFQLFNPSTLNPFNFSTVHSFNLSTFQLFNLSTPGVKT